MTLVNLSGFQYGIESAETGIQVSSFEITSSPEFKKFVLNISGEKRGFAVGAGEQTLSISGEISGATGIMAATFAAAATIANDVDYAGITTGAWYMDRSTITQDREDFKKGTWEFSRFAGVTA